MMYTMPKNLLSICVNFALATQQFFFGMLNRCLKTAYSGYHYSPCFVNSYFSFFCILCKPLRYCRKSAILNILYKDL